MKSLTMKKILYLSLFVIGGCVISDGSPKDYTKIPTEGKTIDIKPFKAIDADGVFNIILSQGDKESVVIKGELPKDLKISNSGDTLVIDDTAKMHNSVFHIKTDIYITVTDLTKMSISSVGSTKSSDTLKFKKFIYESEGVGSTNLLLSVDTLHASEDGVGAMTFAGKAAYASLEDNGVGSLDADAFKAEVLHVNVNGVGAASVYASKEIYIQSSGVGGVKYHGPAKVMQSDNDGVGGIKHVD
jgi:putative autotransporter adhesin-like protein